MLKPIYIFLISLLELYLTSTACADEFLREKQLLKQNNPQQAYLILTNKQASYIGEPEYDILLARSALAAGHPHEAIFAFERVLMTHPNNSLARVELAVAYYQVDELERAKVLFTQALGAKPPDILKATIDNYLARINEKIDSRKHKLNGVLTLKRGWDSNINSATDESTIVLPIFGVYQPTEGVDKQTADSYTEVSNRLNYSYHFNINSEFFSRLDYSKRQNTHWQFDNQTADIRLGYRHTTALGRISVPVSYQSLWLDEKQLRKVAVIGVNLNRSGDGTFTDYTLQYGETRYSHQQSLNMDYVTASIVLGTADNKAVLNQQYAVFYGDETPTNSQYQYNAREYMGMQLRFPIRVSARHYLTPGIVYQVAEYKQDHPFFMEKREDQYASAELNWQWYFSRRWSLTSRLSLTKSDSNIALYTYTRDILFTGINYAY